MNPYLILGSGLGTNEATSLSARLSTWHDAMVAQGIAIGERVPIPEDRIPPDASVEMEAKKAAGYYATEPAVPETTIGRPLEQM